jgi:hypothetical protein
VEPNIASLLAAINSLVGYLVSVFRRDAILGSIFISNSTGIGVLGWWVVVLLYHRDMYENRYPLLAFI